MKKKVLVTGVAGFIGFHLAQRLLESGWTVVGIDNLNDYYDVRIKRRRLKMLSSYPRFSFKKCDIAEYDALEEVIRTEKPRELVHLAAQAGVRYSLTNPWAYADANYVGTMNVFEAAKRLKLSRVVYASSSSVYGNNKKSPFSETDRVDTPISLYAASKKANEVLAYSYHHLYGMEMVGLRFFTVYGRWGRPDMALFKFARRIEAGKPIELYNHGRMKRSFTHVSDITGAIEAQLEKPAQGRYRLYNLGGEEAVPLTTFVSLIEKSLGKKAKIRPLPLQAGDVPSTIADCTLARRELHYRPRMTVEEGIADFISWFKEESAFLKTLDEPKQ
jgi:UDP-glucuronate 4-epimerase